VSRRGTLDLYLPERGRERTNRARRSPISVGVGGGVLLLCGFRGGFRVRVSTNRAPLLQNRAMCSDEEGIWCPFALRWRALSCSVERAWYLVGATSQRSVEERANIPTPPHRSVSHQPKIVSKIIATGESASSIAPSGDRVPLPASCSAARQNLARARRAR